MRLDRQPKVEEEDQVTMPETGWWESLYSLSQEPFKLGSRWLYLVATKNRQDS
jgi:hypothetical protein